jgi:hypothetical protein
LALDAGASFLPTAVGGNIGINSTAPRGRLDVEGTIYGSTLYVDGTSSLNKVVLVPTATQTIAAGSGVTSVPSTLIRIVSSGGAVTVTADPPITTTGVSDGQELVLMGTSNTDTVKFTNGSSLSLSQGVSFTMGAGARLRLIYSAADAAWMELSRQ